MGLHTQNALQNAMAKSSRVRREEANVREDVRHGDLTPAEGAVEIEKVRRRG